MPEMTGLELAARLRADGSGIPILLITGSPSPAIAARAAEVGITKVLMSLLPRTTCSTSSSRRDPERVRCHLDWPNFAPSGMLRQKSGC